jgi:2-polyprenyl-6-methoxyphenol hydroxylase-like FAD-dependent oxidoreductase
VGKIATPEARDLPATADVVVIGGGIVGTATACYASRAGLKTLVLKWRDGLAPLTTTSSLRACSFSAVGYHFCQRQRF